MIPGINPRKMQAMMKQLGIKQEEIDAKRVIIEKEDGKIIIDEPSVLKVNMQGQETFQVSGDIREEGFEEENNEKDIEMIMGKTGKKKEEVKSALNKNDGDIASTILELSQ